MSEWENTVPGIKYPSMAEWENNVPQSHVLFNIFCIYNYTFLFHNICLKDLYMPYRLCEV